ncbi:Dolichyl-diphosphooligosaccharide--protein glycosyltransferase subunit, partial [Lachnellula occidentalis]
LKTEWRPYFPRLQQGKLLVPPLSSPPRREKLRPRYPCQFLGATPPCIKLRGLTTSKVPTQTPIQPPSPSQSPQHTTMAPKRSARDSTPSSTTTTTTQFSSPSVPIPSSKKAGNQSPQEIALGIWESYLDNTPQRTKLIDIFMSFLVVVGVLQFVYCVIAGNYPFNAFLSGFSATVGQFVLTASLRIQTNVENKAEFGEVSPERAFADYVFGSLILHFFCVNFIN